MAEPRFSPLLQGPYCVANFSV